MSVSAADIYSAVNTLWTDSGLDDIFVALGTDVTQFPVLNDEEAPGKASFPYCVFEIGQYDLQSRMSGSGCTIREVRDVPCEFRVHARPVSGNSRNAKQIAAYLAEEIMKVFGGHPTTSPTNLALTNGNFLIAEFLRDYCIREEDEHFMWTLDYAIRVDVPVAI